MAEKAKFLNMHELCFQSLVIVSFKSISSMLEGVGSSPTIGLCVYERVLTKYYFIGIMINKYCKFIVEKIIKL